jgi:hypothetical protein
VRDFAASAGRLRVLSFGAKLLYTAFAISAIIGGALGRARAAGAVGVDAHFGHFNAARDGDYRDRARH